MQAVSDPRASSSAGTPGLALGDGRAFPMGPHVVDGGVNFAVFSEHATAIELCLFEADGRTECGRLRLPARSGDVWHGHLAGAQAGLVYGFRAHGAWLPQQGHRFNPHKLLLDPWAREIVGRFDWSDPHFGHQIQHPLQINLQDNGASALKARVVEDRYDWGDDARPATPLRRSVLYELHVRGFTKLHPQVDEAQRGCYAGLASPAALAHLKRLGVTAVSLLPVQHFVDEQRLVALGLRNHWGYNTLGFFCPEPRYAVNPDGRATRDEFRDMVKRLHRAGIEVILDVVFNHTAETDQFGPTLSWRGLDNANWYRLPPHQREAYVNDTGCGNTVNVAHPRVLQMVMDSLRYWVEQMHVDGFRFDLATVLGRGEHGFDSASAFFACVAQDPVLADVKLIAEPWDIGPGGYQLGRFPVGWMEWNDRFRNDMRDAWLGDTCTRGQFARRLCASADLFDSRLRAPSASINYVVSHDGFTLLDLLSYNHRHNQANGEGNRDGDAHSRSWNCGVEGPSDDPQVRALRQRLQRALLATVLLAQGTPMLAAGDELGHSQRGNNNPYCQDNPTTWIDWSAADDALIAFTARLIALRQRLAPLGSAWLDGQRDSQGAADVTWWHPAGHEMTAADWHHSVAGGLGALLRGRAQHTSLLLLVNLSSTGQSFELPTGTWQVMLDSTDITEFRPGVPLPTRFEMPARGLLLAGSTP
ncbi:MAG: glycogen debranching protein GlgX [Rubrivivax sp.]